HHQAIDERATFLLQVVELGIVGLAAKGLSFLAGGKVFAAPRAHADPERGVTAGLPAASLYRDHDRLLKKPHRSGANALVIVALKGKAILADDEVARLSQPYNPDKPGLPARVRDVDEVFRQQILEHFLIQQRVITRHFIFAVDA